MKKLFFLLLISALFVLTSSAQNGGLQIVPQPASIEQRPGAFLIDRRVTIVANAQDRALADEVNNILSDQGLKLRVARSAPRNTPKIVFTTSKNASAVRGSYTLTVGNNDITINSSTEEGKFHALQTLRQMLPIRPVNPLVIRGVHISDAPRFQYRGMHLDIARHFQPVEFLKKYIDQMSRFKFNRFHWHLTDDQGWRIEIMKYPKLTEIGSKRPETHTGSYTPAFKGDGVPHSGFYTQEQIKDVVAYAKERHITVIPEIELPGHASAALAAYPQLGCKAEYQYKVQMTWGIFKEVFCPTDETFKFLEDVLDETIQLFPDSPYIHIGGDEVLKDHWKESQFVQGLKAKENLKDEHEVQSYFVQRIEKFVNSKGKKIIGWDEILEGGLAPNATVMSWRGTKGGIEAAKGKHDVIMTPTSHLYFDYGQGDPAYEPLNIGSYIPLEKVYSFEPIPTELSAEEAKYIIGAQANLWTEYIKSPSHVEYMVFPRMLALSEVVWSPKETRNFEDFKNRLQNILPRLDKAGINYRIPEPMPVGGFLLNETEAYAFEVSPPIAGAKVHYTKDGSTPTENSPEAPQMISVYPNGEEVVTIKAIVVLPSGRKSNVYAATFLRGKMREPNTLAESKPGVNYEIVVPAQAGGEETRLKGETRGILLTQFEKRIDLKKPFSLTYDGYFKVPTDGVYEFQVDSTWDTTLVLGGKTIIDDVGSATNKKRNALVPLKAGLHKISLSYNHRGGDPHLRFRWGIKGQGLNQAYGGEFVH